MSQEMEKSQERHFLTFPTRRSSGRHKEVFTTCYHGTASRHSSYSFPYLQTKWPTSPGHGVTDATFSAVPSNAVLITTKNYSDTRTINGLCRLSHLPVPFSCPSSCSHNLKLLASFNQIGEKKEKKNIIITPKIE